GDPALLVAGVGATEDQVQAIRVKLGTDRPLVDQFVTYSTGIVRGDFGTSFANNQPVAELIGRRFGPSVQLAGIALLGILILAVPLGMVAGALTRDGRRRRAETAFTGVTSVLGAIPEFLFATFLAFIFAVWLRLLPVAGAQGWESLVLPVASISTRPVMTL